MADLFAQGSTESNLVRLVREKLFTVDDEGNSPNNAAAAEQEGVAYPKSLIEVEPIDWPVKDIGYGVAA